MKKAKSETDSMRAEYDFSKLKGGVQGKYAKRYQAGTNLVLIDPDVYEAFPSADAVNQALRAVLSITKVVRPVRKRG